MTFFLPQHNPPLGTNLSCRRESRSHLFRSLVEEFGWESCRGWCRPTRIRKPQRAPFGHDRHVDYSRWIGPQHQTQLYISASCRRISQARAFPLPKQALVWPEGGYQIYDGGGFEPVLRRCARGHGQRAFASTLTHVYSSDWKPETDDDNHTNRSEWQIPGPTHSHTRKLPTAYRVPENYPRIAFDTPLPVQFRTGEAIPVSGRISDASLSGQVESGERPARDSILYANYRRIRQGALLLSRRSREIYAHDLGGKVVGVGSLQPNGRGTRGTPFSGL